METLEIPLIKKGFGRFLLVLIIYSLGCVYVLYNPGIYGNNTAFIISIHVCLFMYLFVDIPPIIKRLLTKRPGLVINDQGIIENTNSERADFIEWREITRMNIETLDEADYILIQVANPEKYIYTDRTMIQSWRAKRKLKKFGTPVIITMDQLEHNVYDVSDLLKRYWEQSKTQGSVKIG